ncbi:hypothetical protein PspLS_04262 [Pyricularia sp. CBS 133598]|nr:hypothetical protein PspLS_04262 [Pyricularia sp. CBS 133598]
MNVFQETQQDSSRRMYTARAKGYEDSWHPDLSRRITAFAEFKPGDRVLVLACGTGLEVFLAADAVGPSGEVVGVDITDAMLDRARAKLQALGDGGSHIQLLAGDVTKLDEAVPQLAGRRFDVMVCCSAFVLFEDPDAVVASWRRLLEPKSGRMVVDITHEDNHKPFLVFERAARRLGAGVRFPSNRIWVESRDTFKTKLEAQGYKVDVIERLDNISGRGDSQYGAEVAGEQFDQIVTRLPNMGLGAITEDRELVGRLKVLFIEEWEKEAAAGGGQVVDLDTVYVYVARTT